MIVAKAVDAQLKISIDEKNMVVEASITTARGGKIISMDCAKAMLAEAGVVKGVSIRALDTFLGQQFKQPPGAHYSAIIAHGRMPKKALMLNSYVYAQQHKTVY